MRGAVKAGAVVLGLAGVAAFGLLGCDGAQSAGGGEAVGGTAVAVEPRFAEVMTVYKSPTCGCCDKWIEHVQKHGFVVEAHNVRDVRPYKIQGGLPAGMGSCHTAFVGGYLIEGHVPADVIERLLEERPAIAGLAVPGMPMGSPGMEGPYTEPYDIVAFGGAEGLSIYESR